jgi:2Fe-2S ferredoxin
MSGINPYMKGGPPALPKKVYLVRFEHEDPSSGSPLTVEVHPEDLPYGTAGQPGSLLSVALQAGVEIEHTCGGVCACSTCHILVEEGLESCNEASDDELDQLEEAPGLTPRSRLACQTVPDGTRDVRVLIPAWNRNFVREG